MCRRRPGARAGGARPPHSRSPTSSAPGAWSRAPRLAGRPRVRCGAARSRPTSRCATSPSTRSRGRSGGDGLVDPLGGAADLAAGRLRLAAPDGDRGRPAALAAARAPRLRARPAARRQAPRGGARGGAAARAASPRSASTASCAACSRACGPATGCGSRSSSVAPPPCCPRSRRCAASSRAATTISTCSTTRSRCSTVSSRSSAVRRAAFGAEHAAAVAALLAMPLADQMTHGEVLRFGALLHDVAKPQTRAAPPGGRVGFPGHDELGAASRARSSTRLRAAERVRAQVEALTRRHLRLGFLVREAPLSRRALYGYLDAMRSRGRGRHRAVGRRPPRDARRPRRRGDRAPPRARARR